MPDETPSAEHRGGYRIREGSERLCRSGWKPLRISARYSYQYPISGTEPSSLSLVIERITAS